MDKGWRGRPLGRASCPIPVTRETRLAARHAGRGFVMLIRNLRQSRDSMLYSLMRGACPPSTHRQIRGSRPSTERVVPPANLRHGHAPRPLAITLRAALSSSANASGAR